MFFAEDVQDSRSSSGGVSCVLESQTFVPIFWMCKKQTAVSHSGAEFHIFFLDAGLRVECCDAMWDRTRPCGKRHSLSHSIDQMSH